MSQRQQIERILHIDAQIRARQYPNADSLAADPEVSRRVIFVDRRFLIDRMGAPLATDRRRGGWYYTDATWTLPSVMLSEGELLALLLSVEAARRVVGTGLEDSLIAAVEKLADSLQRPVSVDLQALRQHCSFAAAPARPVAEATLLGLFAAIQNSRCVRLDYDSPERDEPTQRVVDPYHLRHAQGTWHVLAVDHLLDGLRVFHVGSIHSWETLSESFQRDPAFDSIQFGREMLGAEYGDEVYEVVLRFDKYQARYIRERQWHPTQEIEELPGGELILSFQTSDWDEVMRFVLQYGSHVEVLEPQDLRDEVAAEIIEMCRAYGNRAFLYDGTDIVKATIKALTSLEDLRELSRRIQTTIPPSDRRHKILICEIGSRLMNLGHPGWLPDIAELDLLD